jgi:hypothetical protein
MPAPGFAASHFTLLPDEDPRAFHGLVEALMSAWEPSGFIETDLVERIAIHRWRLMRALTLEARLAAATLDEAGAVRQAAALGRYIGGIERSIRELQKELATLVVAAAAAGKAEIQNAAIHEQLKSRRLAREAGLAAMLARQAAPAGPADRAAPTGPPEPSPPVRPLNRAERRRQQAVARQLQAA